MYVAGLNLTLTPTATSPGLAEPLIYTTVLVSLGSLVLRTNQRLKTANEKGGEIKRLPTTFVGKLVTPVHGISTIVAPVTYLATLPFTGFKQPEFFESTALPEFAELGEVGKVAVRFVAGVASVCLFRIAAKVVDQLDKQFHFIGVREKPRIIDTGAYGVVRHPLYTVALAAQIVYVPLLWNYTPLIFAVIAGAAFAVKIPIEENLLLTDESVAADYREYQKKVPYRLIPYIW